MNKWMWNKQLSGSYLYDRYNCIGFSFEEKGRNRSFSIHDIPMEARDKLASILQIKDSKFEEWARLEKIDTSKEHYCFWIIVEKVWYQCTKENWNWKECNSSSGKATVTYECPGWKCSKEILQKIRYNSISVRDIPSTGCEKLAKETGLDVREIASWANEFKAFIDEKGFHVRISVPNVWITANILAFEFILNRPSTWLSGMFAPVGGAMGMGYFNTMKSSHKVINCKTFTETIQALRQYKKKIIGFAFFAHGGKNGVITSTPSSSNFHWQHELLDAVRCNGYKLAHIYLMQCYSGYEGTAKLQTNNLINRLNLQNDRHIKQIRKFDKKKYNFTHDQIYQIAVSKINKAMKNCKDITYSSNLRSYIAHIDKEKKQIGLYCEVIIQVNWTAKWNLLGINVKLYKGQNIILFDIGKSEK